MATVELTFEQLRDAILQLPTPQRRKLLAEIERLPSAEEARAADARYSPRAYPPAKTYGGTSRQG